MEREPERPTDQQPGISAWLPGDIALTDERRAHLAARLGDLLRELGKLERLETPELEPAMTPFPARSGDHGAR